MNPRIVVRLALAAGLFGAAIPGAALAQDQGKWWTPGDNQQAQHSGRSTPQGDQRQGDPQQPMQRGSWDRYQFHTRDLFEGRWVAQDRSDMNGRGGMFGQGWNRGMSLPNFLTIDQRRGMVRVADGRNNLLQVIAIDRGSLGFDRNRAALLTGELRGNRLVATGTDERGRQLHQVMTVHGNTLVIRMQAQRGNSGRMVEVEKVYQRA